MPETALLFLLLFVLGLSLGLFVRPIYGLYTYVAVFYAHPPSRWWGEALPDLRWSLIAAVVTLLAVFIHRHESPNRPPWHSHTIARVLILYTAWMWIQTPWSVSPWHIEGAILFTKYLLLFYLIYAIIDDSDKLAKFGIAHLLGCASLGILIYLAPDSGRLDGIGGPGIDNANTLAMHLGTGLMFASFLILSSKGWRRWIVIGSIPFILNGIIQTETRGTMVGLVVAGLATVYFKPNRFRRAYYALAILALIGVTGIASQPFLERLSKTTAAAQGEQEWDNSAQSRIAIVQAQLEMLKDYPLGAGHQGTAALSTKYIDERWWASNSGNRASHNTVMSIAVDQGIPGLILLVILTGAMTRVLVKSKRLDKKGLPDDLALFRAILGGALTTIFVSGMFAQFLKAEVQIWCLALLTVLWQLTVEFESTVAQRGTSYQAKDSAPQHT